MQGYLQPLVARYARNLDREARERAASSRQTLVMQSNGGLVPLAQLPSAPPTSFAPARRPGVMAAARLAAEAGFDHVITGDMGGTSYDVAVVVDGAPRIAETTELDFRVPLRLPMIDVHTIGAGGGSIAYLDRGGILQVGPRSAGAVPGPICFGRGGTEPTVTDANAVLGRINAEHPIGLKHLKRSRSSGAHARPSARSARSSGLGVEQTAEAILTVVNHRMAARTRLLSVEQGHDPRDFALVVFGGAGPLHGAAIMREVGHPHDAAPAASRRSLRARLRGGGSALRSLTDGRAPGRGADRHLRAAKRSRRQRDEGEARLETQRHAARSMSRSRISAEMSYLGQIHTLRVPIESGCGRWRASSRPSRTSTGKEYGNTLGTIPTVMVGLQDGGAGRPREARRRSPRSRREARATAEPARASPGLFRRLAGHADLRARADLEPGMIFAGPAIIEQADTTSVIEPGMIARVDAYHNILVEVA